MHAFEICYYYVRITICAKLSCYAICAKPLDRVLGLKMYKCNHHCAYSW